MNNKQSRVCGPSYHPLTAMLASNRKSLALNILQKYIQKKQNSPPPPPPSPSTSKSPSPQLPPPLVDLSHQSSLSNIDG